MNNTEISQLLKKFVKTYKEKDSCYSADKKNLIAVTHDMKSGGAPIALLSLLKVLGSEFNCYIISPCDGEMTASFLEISSGIYISDPADFECKDFIQAINTSDLYICNTILCGFFAGLAKGTNTPCIWWIHEEKHYIEHFRQYLHSSQYVSTNVQAFAVTEKAKNEITELLDIPCDVLPPVIEDSSIRNYDIVRDSRQDISSILANNSDRVKFFMPANYLYIKGHDLLIKALSLLPEEYHKQACFIFAGAVNDNEIVQYELVKKYADERDNVYILGQLSRDEVFYVEKNSDCVIAPSRVDSLSLTSVEAMIFRCIPLVSDATGISSYIDNENNGYIFGLDSVDDLKTKIQKIIELCDASDSQTGLTSSEEPEENTQLKTIKNNARKIYDKNFAVLPVMERINEIINEFNKNIARNIKSSATNTMKILFYRYKSIYEPDCIDAFNSLGISVDEICIDDNKTKTSPATYAAEKIVSAKNSGSPYLFLFSINFFPVISDLCQKLGVIYVCWSVDCPVNELLFNQIKNTCNRIFLFDYSQYQRFEKYNPGNIFYLPLATNVERLQRTVSDITDLDRKKYSHDITFIGSLYNEKNPMKTISLSDRNRGFSDGIIRAQLEVFGYNFIENAIDDELIRNIKGNDIATTNEGFVASLDRYVAAHSYLGMEIAERERRLTLNALAAEFDVNLYTQSDTGELINVHNRGPANTLTEMPKIFNLSKINLNITMRPIQTGLSLRIYDILGSGGFLITNYQAEIPEIYEIGKDLEVYTSIEELIEKCRYYLIHEDERKAIAENGYRKTLQFHTCRKRIMEMISLMTDNR